MSSRTVATWTCDNCGAVEETVCVSTSKARGRVYAIRGRRLELQAGSDVSNFHHGLSVRASPHEDGGFAACRPGSVTIAWLAEDSTLAARDEWLSGIPGLVSGDYLFGDSMWSGVPPEGWRGGSIIHCVACSEAEDEAKEAALAARRSP